MKRYGWLDIWRKYMHIYLQGSHVLENTFLCVHKKQYQLFHIGLKTITAESDSYNLLDSRGCCHHSRSQPNLTIRQQRVLSLSSREHT